LASPVPQSLAELQFRLTEIEQRRERAQVVVERQHQRLAKLARDGHPTTQAVRTLGAFQQTLEAFQRVSERLQEEADAAVRELTVREPVWIDRGRSISNFPAP